MLFMRHCWVGLSDNSEGRSDLCERENQVQNNQKLFNVFSMIPIIQTNKTAHLSLNPSEITQPLGSQLCVPKEI